MRFTPASRGWLVAVALVAACTGDLASDLDQQDEALDPNAHAFGAAADARVESTSPSMSFGSSAMLRTDVSPEIWTYLRFNVRDLPAGTLKSVKLRLYATNGSSNGPAVFKTDSEWSETAFTWNDRPMPQGEKLDDREKISRKKWVEYDVKAAMAGNGTVTFLLKDGGTDDVRFSSREASSKRPQLVVTIDPQAPDAGTTPDAAAGPDGGSSDPVIVGAGDISTCSGNGDEETARLLDRIPGTVVTLGDNVYGEGSPSQFRDCFDPTWGRHKARMRPAVGNHEYEYDSDASGYAGYFGAAAGERGKYYYSYDIGTWHIIVLNSEICKNGACNAQMLSWLEDDLARSSGKTCTLAIWHHPRFSSSTHHGSSDDVAPLWERLYAANADVVLSGHDHHYERFRPQTPSGQRDDARGITQFLVGTGGRGHYDVASSRIANSAVANDDTFGVLKLTLRPGSYDYEFVPVAGKTFTDRGTGVCH